MQRPLHINLVVVVVVTNLYVEYESGARPILYYEMSDMHTLKNTKQNITETELFL